MSLDVEIKGTDVQFGKIVQIDFGGGSSPGGTSYPLSYSENEDHTVNLISGGTTIVGNLVTLEALQGMDLGSGSGGGMDELNFDKVFEIQYDEDGVTPLSIKAKYDLWSVGSVAAGGLGTTEGGAVVDPGTGEGTTVSYGTESEGQYVPLTVAGSTKNISLSGHTHDYSDTYAGINHSHDTYREKTDNLFIDGIILKKGELQTAISIDDAGNIYVSGNFYATGSVSAGGPGGESSAPVASVVSWGETQEAGYGLLKVQESDTGKLVALSSHTHDYAASTHSHTWSEISNAPTSLPASDVYDWAKAATKPSYSYSEVGAAASGHNHNTSYSKAIFGEEANGGVTLTLYNGALQLPAAKNLRLHNSGDFSNVSAGLTATKLTLKYSSSVSTALKIDANGRIYVEGDFYATGSIAAGAAGSVPTYATMGQVDAAIASAISGIDTGGSVDLTDYALKTYVGSSISTALNGYATESYVQNAISGLGGGDSVDLTGYATETYVTTALGGYSLSTHDHDDDYLSKTGGTINGALVGTYATFLYTLKAKTFTFQDGPTDQAPVSIAKDANGNLVVNGNLHATGSVSSGGVGVLGATQATRVGSVTSAGIKTEIIGTFTVLYSSINKDYTITHNLGRTGYVCTPIIKDPATAVKVYVKDKTTNSIKVVFEDSAGTKVANAFDFIII